MTKSADYNAIPYTIAENYGRNYLRWLTSIIATQTRQIAADLRACPGQTLEGLKLLLEPDNVPVCRTASAPFPTQPGIAASSPVPGSQSFVIFHLTNYFGQKLGKKHGMLTVTEPDAAPLTGLYIFGSPVIHLFTPDGESIMIGDDPRLSGVITWTVWSNTNGTISLSHPATDRFLSFAPDGSCTSRKMRPLEWEQYTIQPLPPASCPEHIRNAAAFLARTDSLTSLHHASYQNDHHDRLFLNVIASLSVVERNVLRIVTGDILKEHLL
ncbi:hypothetical protein GOB93_07560 [Acetobacter musti]|uniref:Uncharacterized protein n=1 Tax=Acetobacter musti TaxID=864732 RepID=A0ABX0JRB9_9PROT|nr:hypothetical protein [Acetobacter musti]NHN84500.1 hypothetical protein [Acetobacter musti]